jgi:hypothetical protein
MFVDCNGKQGLEQSEEGVYGNLVTTACGLLDDIQL